MINYNHYLKLGHVGLRLDESGAFMPSTKPHSPTTYIQAFAWHAAPILAIIHPSTLENYHC